jgi:hypothetical protein
MKSRNASLAVAAALAAAVLSWAAQAGCSSSGDPARSAAEIPESGTGMVFGEFEDARLFEKSLESAPEMRSWSEKEVRDGLSGATIQAKTFGKSVPDRLVLADGKVAAYADGYGQFWLSLTPGRHTLVGRCRGYRDSKLSIEVSPGSVGYVNFYLEPR